MEWPQAELVGECPISVAINLRQPKSWATLDGFSGGVATSGGVSFGDARVEACPTPGGSADCTGWAQPVQQLPNVGTASCGGAIGSDCVPWARPLHKPPDSGTGTRSPRAMAILSNASMEPSRLPSPVRRGRTTSAPPKCRQTQQSRIPAPRSRSVPRLEEVPGSEVSEPGKAETWQRAAAARRMSPWPKKLSAASLSEATAKAYTALTAAAAGTAITRAASSSPSKNSPDTMLPAWPLRSPTELGKPQVNPRRRTPSPTRSASCGATPERRVRSPPRGASPARRSASPSSRLRQRRATCPLGSSQEQRATSPSGSPRCLDWAGGAWLHGRPPRSQSRMRQKSPLRSQSPIRWPAQVEKPKPQARSPWSLSPPRWGTSDDKLSPGLSRTCQAPTQYTGTSLLPQQVSGLATPAKCRARLNSPGCQRPVSHRGRQRSASPSWCWSKVLLTPQAQPALEETHEALVDVFLRVRPLNSSEQGEPLGIRLVHNSVSVNDASAPHKQWYDFQGIIDSSSGHKDQEKVFDALGKQVVQSVLAGFDTCIFSLGQTGTGKTHTLLGTPEDPGLLPRLASRLLLPMQSQQDGECEGCHLSCLELHMDRTRDLLLEGPVAKAPEVRCVPEHGVYVSNLTSVLVRDAESAATLIHTASRNRVVSQTCMNPVSSRGHGVYELKLVNGARLCVVDLAGRENEKGTRCKGQNLAELGYINKSLFHLTNVIQSLAKRRIQSPQGRIPFRDSKLTLLLSEYLQSARTFLVATISPATTSVDETLTTLRLAQAVRQITTRRQGKLDRRQGGSGEAKPGSEQPAPTGSNEGVAPLSDLPSANVPLAVGVPWPSVAHLASTVGSTALTGAPVSGNNQVCEALPSWACGLPTTVSSNAGQAQAPRAYTRLAQERDDGLAPTLSPNIRGRLTSQSENETHAAPEMLPLKWMGTSSSMASRSTADVTEADSSEKSSEV